MTSCKRSEMTHRINAVNNCKALKDLYDIIEVNIDLDLNAVVEEMRCSKDKKMVRIEIARIQAGIETCFAYIDSNLSSTEFISNLSRAVNNFKCVLEEELCLN